MAEAEADEERMGAGFDFTDPNSPLAPYYLQAGHLIGIAILGVIFLIVNSTPLWHTDVWGHMKFGQWMVDHGRLPDREPFCEYADKSAEYINYQWLSQLALYGTYHLGERIAGGDEVNQMAGGVELLRLLHALLTVFRFFFLWIAFKRLCRSAPIANIALIVTVVLSLANMFVLRPQVFAELLFALLLMLLCGRRTWLSYILIPLTMILWANTHGSYPVGLIVLGSHVVGHGVGWWIQSSDAKPVARARLRDLVMVTFVSVVGIAVANPHGPYLYAHTLQLSQHPNIADMDEWKRIDFASPWGILFLISIGLLVAVSVVLIRFRREFSSKFLTFITRDGLLILFFGIQTYLHQRMMPWWVMLVPWMITTYLGVFTDNFDETTAKPSLWQRLMQIRSVPSLRKTLLGVVIVWIFLAFSGPAVWITHGEPRLLGKSVHAGTPWQPAIQLKKDFASNKQTGRVFASETQGDYLLWALSPEIPVVLYTHVHLFPREHWQKCQIVKAGGPGWDNTVADFRANVLIFEGGLHKGLYNAVKRAADWTIIIDESRAADPKRSIVMAVRKKP